MNLDEEAIYYSPSTRGFYYLSIHGPSMPPDSRIIMKELANEIRVGQLSKDVAHDAQGMPYLVERVVTKEAKIALLNSQVESFLDAQAAKYNYKSIDQAVSFANEATIAQYQAEGKAFSAWRAKVYAVTEAQMSMGVYDFELIVSQFPAFSLAGYL